VIVHDAEPDQPGAGAALPESGRRTAADEAATASAAATSRERGTINSLAQTVLRVYPTEREAAYAVKGSTADARVMPGAGFERLPSRATVNLLDAIDYLELLGPTGSTGPRSAGTGGSSMKRRR
jgi:hypothetical protein